MIVSSSRYTVDDAQFKTFVANLTRTSEATGGIATSHTYYSAGDESLVSQDRHAALVPVFIVGEDEAPDVVAAVEEADANPDFEAAITGNQTRDADSNKLSESDLSNGELKFGLPAALIILLLVFGTVVAGLVPLLMAIVSILVALGLVAVLTQHLRALDLHRRTCSSGMGLALGIDYCALRDLALPGGTRKRARAVRRDLRVGGDREPRGAVQRVGIRRRDVRAADRPVDDLPKPRGRSDPRGDHLGARGADAPAGAARPPPRPRQRAPAPVLRARGAQAARRRRDGSGARVVDRVQRRPWLSLVLATALLARAGDARPSECTIGTRRRRARSPTASASKQRLPRARSASFPAAGTDPAHIVVLGASTETLPRLPQRLRRPAREPTRASAAARLRSRRGRRDRRSSCPVRGDPVGRRRDRAPSATFESASLPTTYAGTNADPAHRRRRRPRTSTTSTR